MVNLVAYTGVWYLYEPRLIAGGFDPRVMAYLVAGTYFIRALGTRLDSLIDRFLKPKHTPIFLALFQTIGSLLSFISNSFGAIGSVYLRKIADGYRQPTVLAMQNNEIESKYRATSLSALSLIANLLVSLIGLLIGVGLDQLGAPKTMGIFGILGFFVVTPLSLKLSKLTKNYALTNK